MLPIHHVQQRATKLVPFPRSRLSWIIILSLGTLALYSFYYLSPPDSRWSRLNHPKHPPPLHDHLRPFEFPEETINRPPEQQATPVPKVDSERALWQSRADDVKQSFLHAWNSYERHAWGQDELLPISRSSVQNFNGWGVSIVDALDTLLLMDHRSQFESAMEHVAAMNFSQTPGQHAPFFETTIRYLGGLLSAYALVIDDGLTSGLSWRPGGTNDDEVRSKQQRNRIAGILLSRAEHLARALMPAFNTTSGLPVYGVNTISGSKTHSYPSLLAEIGSCQLEYKYLAHITGRREYFVLVNNVTDILETLQQKQMHQASSTLGGMLPTKYSVVTGEPIDESITVGALADSAYEYFLKGYLLTGRTESRLLDMYLASVDTALRNMTYVSTTRELVYITDVHYDFPAHKMEHLSCFYPGLLSLGVELLSSGGDVNDTDLANLRKVELPGTLRDRHQWAAEAVAETCWTMYADNPTGLGSEEIVFDRALIPETAPVSPIQNSLNKTDLAFTAFTNHVYYVPVGVEHNRWWPMVDKWESDGRSSLKAPGIHGHERKSVVTNGGKGSWEVYYGDYPSENETPFKPLEMSNEEAVKDTPPLTQQRPVYLRTHLRDYKVRDGRWLMRPETIESFYLLYRSTGDPIWRDRCYSVYKAMERYSRSEIGYASVLDVDYEDTTANETQEEVLRKINGIRGGWPSKEDSMPSYALAETFKYLYLCMMDRDDSTKLLPPDRWIFNTEAHPLPVFDWTELERKQWEIRIWSEGRL